MESTGTSGVGRCFVKAFLCYDSILRQEFDVGLQTLQYLKTVHASATNTALAELEKLHNSCEQNPEALKQHRMQLLTHMENAFETRRRKVEQTLWEDKNKNKMEREKLEEIGALLRQHPQDFGLHQPTLADYQIQQDIVPDRTSDRAEDRASGDQEKTELKNDSLVERDASQQPKAELSRQKEEYESELKVLSNELEHVKQLLSEKENTASRLQAQLDAQRQHYETLVKSHLEKISQLEQERDQEAKRKKTACENLEAEVERYRVKVQSMKTALDNTRKENQELSEQYRQQREHNERKEEALRAKENELRQLRDQEKRKETELKAQRDKLSEVQQRINRNRTRRLEILTEARKISDEVFDITKGGLARGVIPIVGAISGIPTVNAVKAKLERLDFLLAELRRLDD